jgi:hypothetical protein
MVRNRFPQKLAIQGAQFAPNLGLHVSVERAWGRIDLRQGGHDCAPLFARRERSSLSATSAYHSTASDHTDMRLRGRSHQCHSLYFRKVTAGPMYSCQERPLYLGKTRQECTSQPVVAKKKNMLCTNNLMDTHHVSIRINLNVKSRAGPICPVGGAWCKTHS